MSWTDIFPVLDDEMLGVYRAGVTDVEKAEFEEWFGIKTFHGLNVEKSKVETSGEDEEKSKRRGAEREISTIPNPLSAISSRHVVSATLFWKHVNEGDPELPLPTREKLVDARRMGLVKRFDPWDSYVAPLFTYTRAAVKAHPDVTFRLYLAADLEFLVPDLNELGWEVCVMESSSVRYCPGGFWRFLALEEEGVLAIPFRNLNETNGDFRSSESSASRELQKPGAFLKLLRYSLVMVLAPLPRRALHFQKITPAFVSFKSRTGITVIDTDRMNEVSHEIERTKVMANAGLGLWRVPGYYNSPLHEKVRYRPILGGHFGARGGMPVRELIEAFVWHWRNDSLPLTANIPGVGERPIRFSKWPNYGFDEWWQLAALYPRLAPGGTLTFIPSDARSLLLPADVEYAQWANPRSECVYF